MGDIDTGGVGGANGVDPQQALREAAAHQRRIWGHDEYARNGALTSIHRRAEPAGGKGPHEHKHS